MATKKKLLEAAAGALDTPDTGDPEFANVALLLDGDGTSDDNNNTFTDSSTNNLTASPDGTVVQGSFSPYGDNWSNYFDGVSQFSLSDSTALYPSGDFTVEAWVYRTTTDTHGIFAQWNSTSVSAQHIYFIRIQSNIVKFLGRNSGGSFFDVAGSISIPTHEWTHIAVTRSGNVFSIFVDGVLDVAETHAQTLRNSTADYIIADQGNGNENLDGYISNLRYVNGTALYTSSFTVPTEPLTAVTNTVLLTCQSNRFIDSSTENNALTPTNTPKVTPFSPFKNDEARTLTANGGSAYFDGGDHDIQWGASGDLALGSGDWSVETWFYMNAFPSASTGSFLDWRTLGSAPTNVPVANLSSAGNVNWYGSVGSGIEITSNTPLRRGEWTHIAIAKSGTTTTMYFNGESVGSFTDTRTYAAQVFGMANIQTNYGIDSYYSDLRILIGSSAYSSTFTPPTAPLTAVTNTKLLASFQDAGIYDLSGINNLDTVGDARLGFAPIYGTGSIEFDGSGDALESPYDKVYAFGGDFTIELWIYYISHVGSYTGIIFCANTHTGSGAPTAGWILSFFSTGDTLLWEIAGSGGINATSSPLTKNRWVHLAVVRSGSTVTLYMDGTSIGSHTASGTVDSVSFPLRVGRGRDTVNTPYFEGYMDDIRITNGIARYTSNFTPPTEIDLALDTYAENVVFFLDGNGPANGQNNTFTDSSTNGFTVTESGSVVQGVFSPYGDNWSNYFSDGSAYLTASPAAPGTGEFCYECWINVPQASDDAVLETRDTNNNANGFTLTVLNSSTIRVYSNNAKITASGLSYLNQWTHLCVEKVGSTTTLYINGVSYGTTTDLANMSNTNFRIGESQFYGAFSGYIADFRYVRGGYVYNGNFTPPTSPLTAVANTELLTCSSNRFVDESTNNHTVTVNGDTEVTRFSPFESNKPYDITTDGGSAYWDGSSYLNTASGATALGTGNLTVEFWINTTDTSFNIMNPDSSTGNGFWGLMVQSGDLRWNNQYNLTNLWVVDGAPILDGAWHHVAIIKNSNVFKVFYDGVSQSIQSGSFTDPYNYPSSDGLRIGSGNLATFTGYLSDIRLLAGTALYSSDFTPPTAPLTAVTNTKLLMSFQDSAIPDLSGLNNIDTVGNAKVGASDPTKYGSNAMQFGGTTDRLITLGPDLLLGTGDFTIEFWIYFNSVSDGNIYTILDGRTASDTSNLMWAQESSGSWTIFNGAGSNLNEGWSSGTFTTGVWYHLAQTRESGVSRFFKDGTQTSGDLSDTSDYNSSTYSIGGRYAVGGYSLDGYIDDFRITKGIARYTANFTPPSEALPKF